jgi:hypothetical protein
MPTHKITLINSSQTPYVLNPTSSPLSVDLAAQRSNKYFAYGSVFPDVEKVVLEVDDNQSPLVTLAWVDSTNPYWGMTLVVGSTSYSVSVSGHATKFEFTLPSTGQLSTFQLSPANGAHELEVTVKRK